MYNESWIYAEKTYLCVKIIDVKIRVYSNIRNTEDIQ